MAAVGILNTAIGSTNIGDSIIMEACRQEIEASRPHDQLIDFTSHDPLMVHSLKVQHRHISWNALCGTNCLASRMFLRSGWRVNVFSAMFMRPVTTLGVGWGSYSGRPNLYTRNLLRRVLGKSEMLSVRDSYTKDKLNECGLDNVVNTGCLTLWSLDESHCKKIPAGPAPDVVYTFTDYSPDAMHDLEALRQLSGKYRTLYIWMQGAWDERYYKSLEPSIKKFMDPARVVIVPPRLAAYDSLLDSKQVDYVGTRLHGGIRALQKGRRTLILGVDNRAIEMGKDFNLPVIKREDHELIPSLVSSDRPTQINLPVENIAEFRKFLRSWDV